MQQTYQCPNCGAPVTFGFKFCNYCRMQLNWPTQQQSLTRPPYQQPQGNHLIQQQGYSDSTPQESKWYFLKANGRFSRSQFAFFYFIPILITLVLYGLISIGVSSLRDPAGYKSVISWISIVAGLLIWPWLLLQIYIVIVAGIRRLHDLNWSGWWILFAFVPIANMGLLLIQLFSPGKTDGNRWQ